MDGGRREGGKLPEDDTDGNSGDEMMRTAEETIPPEAGSILEEIWRSVMTPGIPNSRVQMFFNFVFLLLFAVLLFMFYISGFNLHVLVLIGAAIGLFVSLQW